MQIKLINPTYSYAGGIVTYSVTAQFIDNTDPANPKVLYEETFSAKVNLDRADWQTMLESAITAQINETSTRYQSVMQKIQSVFPTATSPDDAMLQFTTNLETRLNGGV